MTILVAGENRLDARLVATRPPGEWFPQFPPDEPVEWFPHYEPYTQDDPHIPRGEMDGHSYGGVTTWADKFRGWGYYVSGIITTATETPGYNVYSFYWTSQGY